MKLKISLLIIATVVLFVTDVHSRGVRDRECFLKRKKRAAPCCDDSIYDPRTQMCCNDRVYSRSSYLCCLGNAVRKPVSSARCCGKKAYDPSFSGCCGGVVYVTRGIVPSVCCGGRIYNPHTQLCCQNNVQDKPSLNAACCGSVAYDTQSQVCCGSRRVNSKPPQATLISCCNSMSYDPAKYSCCNGIIRPLWYHCCVGNQRRKGCQQIDQ